LEPTNPGGVFFFFETLRFFESSVANAIQVLYKKSFQWETDERREMI